MGSAGCHPLSLSSRHLPALGGRSTSRVMAARTGVAPRPALVSLRYYSTDVGAGGALTTGTRQGTGGTLQVVGEQAAETPLQGQS